MDKINLSEIRAKFPDYADVPDYQLLGALHRKFYSDMPRDQFLGAINYDTSRPDPTAGNSFLQNVGIGIGKGMTSIARAVGVSPDFLARHGLPASKEEADALDAPLMRTAGGKVGNLVGHVALAAPTALVPGANTYAGAALIGGLTGGGFTEGDATERAKNAVFGTVGGLAGKGLGDLVGWGAPKVAERLRGDRMAAQSANVQRDAAARLAQQNGYVLPPSDVNPSFINEALGGLSGKIKTAQVASERNQDATNLLARRALGMADDAPLTPQTLDQLRAQAGKAYADVSKLGAVDIAGQKLPAGVRVAETNSPLLFGKQKSVDMGDVVNAWRQYNADATAYFRSYSRTADPETLTKARSAAAAAKQIDQFMTEKVAAIQKNAPQKLTADLAAGQGDLVEALKAARQQIAKTYTVEKALNGVTGDVSAQALAKELAKGKPLSGDLLTAAQVAQAFPKATQTLKEAPKAVSPLDYAMGMIGAGSSGLPGMAAVAARPAVRSLILSKPYQGLLGQPETYGTGLLWGTLPALESEALRRSLPLAGGLLGANVGQ